MNDKLIGFTVSKRPIQHTDVDVFDKGLSMHTHEANGFHIYFWGIGEIENCFIEGRYCFSFPKNTSLLDRNVLITINDSAIEVENDWLGSIPVYYNQEDLIVSTLPLKCLTNKEVDPVGLKLYAKYGYSVLGRTTFKKVRQLRYYSRLIITHGDLIIEKKIDPINNINWEKVTDEVEVINKIRRYLEKGSDHTNGQLILPTSGGFDSRILNLLYPDLPNVRTFSYGVSNNQTRSKEVVIAKNLASSLGTSWEQITLGNYFSKKSLNDWFKIFGFSTHLHGMYQIEFYDRILSKFKLTQCTLLSGIIGDVWSGKVEIGEVNSPDQVKSLGLSHGVRVNHDVLNTIEAELDEENFFNEHEGSLKNIRVRLVHSMRFKITLLSYLMTLPEYFGVPSWTPFLNFDVVCGILKLSEKRRINRQWQVDLFKSNGVSFESMNLRFDRRNTLNYRVFLKSNIEPLDLTTLDSLFPSSYLEKVNTKLRNKSSKPLIDFMNRLLQTRYIGGALYRLGFRENRYENNRIMDDYLICKSIEMSLKCWPR